MDAAVCERVPESFLQTALGHGLGGAGYAGMAAPRRREDQHWMAMRDPVLAQQFQRALWQGDIPIFPAFAMPDVDHHARAVDISHVKMGALLQAQTTGGDR